MLDYRFVWESYTTFLSESTAQKLLFACYKQNHIQDADKKSYENCYPFIYYLEHGQNYYQLANKSPLSIKPVLLFYGMIQLLKACLLTVDPQYPESTSVLAHGVTTRKRKKQSYEFLHDEVKVQRNGLFSHFSEKMFQIKQLEGEKYSMEELLYRIPETSSLFSFPNNSDSHYSIHINPEGKAILPKRILDDYHMTLQRFTDFIKSNIGRPDLEIGEDMGGIQLLLEKKDWPSPTFCSPFLYHLYEQSYCIPKSRERFTNFPEVMVHYLLLYNLSMISRYETEWWSELLHSYSSNDYPYIHRFLSITADKIPYLLYLFLLEQAKK